MGDRTWKGTDHAASLEPAGLEKLCRDLQAAHKCMTYKEEDILPIEKEQRAKLKWGCYNAKQLKRGNDASPKKATSPTTSKEPKSPKSPTTKKSEPSPKKAKA